MDRLGERLDVLRSLLADPVDHLLGEQRVAGRALGDLRRRARPAVRPSPLPPAAARRRARGSRPGSSGSSAIVVALRRPPPQPGRRSSSSSRARQTISAGPAHPARQVLDQVEHALVGPVDVLDRDHHAAGAGSPPRPASAPRRTGGRASAAGPRLVDAGRPSRARPAARCPSGRAIVAASRSGGSSVSASETQRLDPAQELAPRPARSRRCRRSRTGRGRSRRAPSRRARRRRRGSCPTRKAGFSGRSPICARQLAQQARLADPGLADHGDQVRAALADHPLEQRQQQRRLVLAADQRRRGAGARGSPGPGPAARTASQAGTGSDLPFSVERLELVVLDRAAGQAVGDLADGDAARARPRAWSRAATLTASPITV